MADKKKKKKKADIYSTGHLAPLVTESLHWTGIHFSKAFLSPNLPFF